MTCNPKHQPNPNRAKLVTKSAGGFRPVSGKHAPSPVRVYFRPKEA